MGSSSQAVAVAEGRPRQLPPDAQERLARYAHHRARRPAQHGRSRRIADASSVLARGRDVHRAPAPVVGVLLLRRLVLLRFAGNIGSERRRPRRQRRRRRRRRRRGCRRRGCLRRGCRRRRRRRLRRRRRRRRRLGRGGRAQQRCRLGGLGPAVSAGGRASPVAGRSRAERRRLAVPRPQVEVHPRHHEGDQRHYYSHSRLPHGASTLPTRKKMVIRFIS